MSQPFKLMQRKRWRRGGALLRQCRLLPLWLLFGLARVRLLLPVTRPQTLGRCCSCCCCCLLLLLLLWLPLLLPTPPSVHPPRCLLCLAIGLALLVLATVAPPPPPPSVRRRFISSVCVAGWRGDRSMRKESRSSHRSIRRLDSIRSMYVGGGGGGGAGGGGGEAKEEENLEHTHTKASSYIESSVTLPGGPPSFLSTAFNTQASKRPPPAAAALLFVVVVVVRSHKHTHKDCAPPFPFP
jgi:hypothetical protein